MKVLSSLILLMLSLNTFADTWKWETTVGSLRSYGGSTTICFETDGLDRKLCFDQGINGGDIKLSMLLAAKMSNSLIDVSYSTPQNGEMAAWYNHEQFYWAHHMYIR